MANLTSAPEVFSGDTAQVDTTKQYTLGTKAFDSSGNEYIYMQGVTSGAAGRWVTYDEDYVTTLLAANAAGPVGVMMAALDATTDYGWVCVRGTVSASIAANTADNAPLGFETTAGYAGDGRAAGDMIYGAWCRTAVTTAGNNDVQILYPFVTDGATV